MEYESSGRESLRSNLKRIFDEKMALNFPPSDGEEEIEKMHDLLILYDATVAAAVLKIMKASSALPESGRLTGLRKNPELQRLIDSLVVKYPPEHDVGRVARQYADYYGIIKKLILAARSYLDYRG